MQTVTLNNARPNRELSPLVKLRKTCTVFKQAAKLKSEYDACKTDADYSKLGQKCASVAQTLGPAYIKIGQMVSSRPDALHPHFASGLASLQDDVPPMHATDFADMISSLDTSKFSSLETEPLKSASIGQVHLGRYGDDKRKVVVKVLRKGIREHIRADSDDVKKLVWLMERIGIDTRTTGVLEEALTYLQMECDFENEAKNLREFGEFFRDVDWIKVPEVYREACNEDVIVMEYVPSHRLDRLPPKVSRKAVSAALITSYVYQTVLFDKFHADPHNGNIGFSTKGEGMLVFYDFGSVVDMPPKLRKELPAIMMAVASEDAEAVFQGMVNAEVLTPVGESLKSEVVDFIGLVINYAQTLRLSGSKDGEQVDEDSIQRTVLTLARSKPFEVTAPYMFLGKAFITIEGTLRQINGGSFSYAEMFGPVVDEIVNEQKLGLVSKVSEIAMDIASVPASTRYMRASLRKTGAKVKQLETNMENTKVVVGSMLLVECLLEIVQIVNCM